MRVCYWGTYRQDYTRNQIMIAGLREAGVDVIECHRPLWLESNAGIEERVKAASGGWLNIQFLKKAMRIYYFLVKDFFSISKDRYDIVIVGYPGQLDVFIARLISWQRGKPLVWDVFMSIYLIAIERGLEEKSKFTTGLLKTVEKLALRLPDLLIQDTQNYVEWFETTYKIGPKRFRLVPTGAEDNIYFPKSFPESDKEFIVTYQGTFIPNHGIPYIIEAASLLAGQPGIRFEMIGNGPDRAIAEQMVKNYGLSNVCFIGWLDKENLVHHLASSSVILGAFGLTPQSLMTIQNKIFQGMALKLPVISGDSPAVRQALADGEHILLCDRNNPRALADSILLLYRDPKLRSRIAENGYAIFREAYSVRQIGHTLKRHLESLVARKKM